MKQVKKRKKTKGIVVEREITYFCPVRGMVTEKVKGELLPPKVIDWSISSELTEIVKEED